MLKQEKRQLTRLLNKLGANYAELTPVEVEERLDKVRSIEIRICALENILEQDVARTVVRSRRPNTE